MAIQKSKTLSNGAVGNYWKITQLSIDRMSKNLVCVISLFSDKAHADAKAPNLGLNKTYSFSITKSDLVGDLVELSYTKIKAKAASMVHKNIFGEPSNALIKYDLDIDGGEDV